MTTTFITGANKSLGYETARRLIEAGHTVLVGARDPERGRAAADALGARFIQIDVTDDASVAEAAADIGAREGGHRRPDQQRRCLRAAHPRRSAHGR
ncbi:hypothetical protein STRIP9103_08465 [Streptomyces ipomoeae 91-03]|uniref:Oxidoreductase, short chain dehydrogenase/reductase family protein n=1 Tax=Streptomyces ipomoeae 91-03 TaxID=698759 RepID=L1KW22_9ACTN|nr:hypothetical protein STRIP9103_08465 [Streptomyces ipomoeae 91-03]